VIQTLGRGNRPTRKLIAATLGATLSLSLGAGIARGDGGGVATPDPPNVTDVVCVDSCAGLRAATVGSRVALSGSDLAGVTKVGFDRRDGSGRTAVDPVNTSENRVVAIVPEGAGSGRPRAADSYGRASTSPTKLSIVGAKQAQPSGTFKLQQAKATPRKAYFAGASRAKVQFVFSGKSAQDVRVDVVRRGSGQVVKSIAKQGVQPGEPASATWSGMTSERKVAPNGQYRFRVAPMSAGVGDGGGSPGFSYFDHKFPVRARHSYGDGIGAGRGHQGQDVFARCGSRLVAARAGRVQTRGYDGRGGYYVVIDGHKTGIDYVYMHLAGPASVREGQLVRTGQTIGRTGETGNASGCHLHFEVWSAPGWYEGGSPMHSVTRLMKRWDRWG
jgi:murein DD-endopeptidase MepM/ murein hydrolase activator NlpD